MPQYEPSLRPERPLPTPRRPSPRTRSSRNALLLLFIVALLGAVFILRYEETGRLLPFIRKDVPPVTGLHPVVREKADQLVAEAAAAGIAIYITDDFRSEEEQNVLFEQGRSTRGPIVTHARGGESYHNYGLAIDFALQTEKGQVIWDLEYDGNGSGESDWLEVVAIAKRLGFEWGGDWEGFKDYPHLQMDFGYSISQLQRGFRPPDTPLAADAAE